MPHADQESRPTSADKLRRASEARLGSLGDSRLWEPVAQLVARRFRSVTYDQRFFGRSIETAEKWSTTEDAISILDRFDIERAAIVGLSGGGKVAIDVALAHPKRVWALGHMAGALTGMGFELPSPEGIDDPMERDLAIWAPLGADNMLRELVDWHSHEHEDEIFLVLEGNSSSRCRGGSHSS
jgi:pimeloyl-ACP methyl ester carboxylesterase